MLISFHRHLLILFHALDLDHAHAAVLFKVHRHFFLDSLRIGVIRCIQRQRHQESHSAPSFGFPYAQKKSSGTMQSTSGP